MTFKRAVVWGCFGLLVAGCIKRTGAECGEVASQESGSVSGDWESLPRTDVLGPKGLAAFEVHGQSDEDIQKVVLTKVAVEGQEFTEALQAEIKEGSNSEWSVQTQAPTAAKVEKGDLLLATFFVRSIQPQESGRAETQFVFELAGEPYTKSATHNVPVTPEWRKVHVRFASKDDYAPGGAQMIFRLGYEPETIQIGGFKLENFGHDVSIAALPTTAGIDKKLEGGPVVAKRLATVNAGELRFEIKPDRVVGAISPYVYGINSQKLEDTGATVRRQGGNRQTVYNWEINASNAGSDWKHSSDDWPCTGGLGYKGCDVPGAQITLFAEENRKDGIESLVTIPMIDYASADKKGSVAESEAAPSKRFVRSYAKKPGGRYSLTPDLNDGKVYQDELVNFMVQKLGKAEKGGVKFYSLDNEPALWPTTHPRVHPDRTTYAEIVARTEATASAITKLDPTAVVLGGVMFGWSEFMSLSSAPDAKKYEDKYPTYVEYFLASMRQLEKKHGRRLVHVLDVHWYPEVRGTKRITDQDASRKTIDARLRAPRSFWDPDFTEKSWITDQWKKPIRLIPWLKELIAKHYPGTKLSMTEYNFGGDGHMSGTLAQIDLLGIFGREGMYMANYWGRGAGVGKLPPHVAAAFRLYRNYDGRGGRFGDRAVEASVADISKATIYAATDTERPGRMTVIVINKDQQGRYQGQLSIAGDHRYTKANVYSISGDTPEIKSKPAIAVQGNQITYTLEPLSATLFICE